ncbi:hypothetical protein GUITHDRAFT_116648 [Guillardia theta CCMP2712]|uniref:PH domain-containing protein n=1 Tax=Guillardia theta (strain CCMP2712) TaxID=905079 RepID=L1IMW5_GUITC|nr:hypothetical protein GUITHDRAFT_116648 [Guillardia theta CCMP2712]EKX37234.1 hypothetical protein GUITHDRAFT_116648 [Guillardia theta CCMP2712]|eukprot:XP_005824214.1 hypothetical protein GUITHDRAFT_116648 [Guillardia theta CCMP2712]
MMKNMSRTSNLRENHLYQLICEKRKEQNSLAENTSTTLFNAIVADEVDEDDIVVNEKKTGFPPTVRLSSLRPLITRSQSSQNSSLDSSSLSSEPQDDTELLRSRIQAVFLTYRSPNTTPKQYVSHAQLLESFKDLADTVSGPNAFSVASTSCSCHRPHSHSPSFPSTSSIPSGEHGSAKNKPRPVHNTAARAQGRCECEGVHGVVEMRSKRGSRPPEKVRCSIQSSSGKMILSIFGGSDYGTEVGFIRLEESYVATYGEKPLTFAVGLRSRRECFEESEIHFSCHTSVSRDKWVGALIQGGSKSRRMLSSLPAEIVGDE